jgi:CBS domain-containing protein
MTHFAMPVSSYMSAPVVTVPERAPLAEVEATLRERAVSCVPVVDDEGRHKGVISRTDLLRVGRLESRMRAKPAVVALPDREARELMQWDVVTVAPGAHVDEAARRMLKQRIHRVFVEDGGRLVGVFSTKDVLRAVHDKRVEAPIGEAMSAPVFTIPASSPLSLAIDRLEKAHVGGLVVIDDDAWPVGMFTQAEGLGARGLPGDTPLEEAMSYAMLCLEVRTPLYRAAAHAHATRARRVLAIADHRVRGILTGLDFARVATR